MIDNEFWKIVEKSPISAKIRARQKSYLLQERTHLISEDL
jgi:hypothetical protein